MTNNVLKLYYDIKLFFSEFYLKVTSLKKVGIKVTIAIGGWNDSEGDKYSRLVNNPSARRKFVDHVVGFVEKYNFDGLDLDWEYPSCWQVRKKCFFMNAVKMHVLIFFLNFIAMKCRRYGCFCHFRHLSFDVLICLKI